MALTVAMIFGCIAHSHACSVASYSDLRAWIKREDAANRNLDIVECLQSNDEALTTMAAHAGDQADLLRYLVAWSTSNAIEKGGLAQRHAFAGSWWQRYLENVQPPLDRARINHAIVKLVQHGRLLALDQYLPTIFRAFQRLDRRVDASTTSLLLNTLYRCDSWSVPRAPRNEVVCRDDCKLHFEAFAESVDPDAPASRWSASTRSDFKAMTGRLQCAQ